MKLTYQNPVWSGYLADPFVLKWQDVYYAYGTGSSSGTVPEQDGKLFPVLRSTNLAHWEYSGGALLPGSMPGGTACWAPEVVAHDGHFYLYYSAALGHGDEQHRLRVAMADHPTGPFTELGPVVLGYEGFAIDAHPFRDPDDGQWYLFFARDFFDARVGTGLAAVRLAADMRTTLGVPVTILRATADWQIYERNRQLYDRIWPAWHTLEGPCVVVHDGRYYCLYSGGNWHTEGYGIGYAVADEVLGPYRELEYPSQPRILRGIPGRVLGPGHNSVVSGPDDTRQFLVYHSWDLTQVARHLCIDPLIWTPQGPRCAGPTVDPQFI